LLQGDNLLILIEDLQTTDLNKNRRQEKSIKIANNILDYNPTMEGDEYENIYSGEEFQKLTQVMRNKISE